MPTRLQDMIKRCGLTLQEVADAADPPATPSEVSKLARGLRRVSKDWARRLAPALNCTPAELFDETVGPTIPVRFNVYSAFAEGIAEPPALGVLKDRPDEQRRLTVPPSLARPEQCFAANVLDDSADRLYPRGSILIVREVEAAPALRVGQRVLVAHYTDATRSRLMEVLVGLLERGSTGDLTLALRSNNRELPHSLLIQSAVRRDAMRERLASYQLPGSQAVEYAMRSDDLASVLGVVAMAITPEEE